MANSARPRPGSTLSAPGKDLTCLAAPPGRLRFREDVGPDGAAMPLHVHVRQTERFTMIEGQLLLTLDDQMLRLAPGQSREVPPGRLHSYGPRMTRRW